MKNKLIKKELPHGAIIEIAKRTKLSKSTISKVLNGVFKSSKNSMIFKATADYLSEYRANEKEAERLLNEALKLQNQN